MRGGEGKRKEGGGLVEILVGFRDAEFTQLGVCGVRFLPGMAAGYIVKWA